MKQPKTLQEAIIHFANPENCLAYMVAHRWPEGVECPSCGRKDAKFLAVQRKWQCKSVHAKRQFTTKVGTIFEDSPLGFEKWLPVVWMIANCKNGVSSFEIARAIGVTQKTAWFMLHRIRLAMQSGSLMKVGGSGAPVEVDETFIGGKTKNMHYDRRVRFAKQGGIGGSTGKAVVMGKLDRDVRRVRATVIPNVKRDTLQTEILKHIESASIVYTDQWVGYDGLAKRDFVHATLNHMETYVSGQVHTQGIENSWS